MKYSNFFIFIFLIVFCTDRLQHIFYIGFFDFYPSRALFLILIPFFSYREFVKRSSKEIQSVYKVIVGYLFVVLLSALNSPDVFYSFKKWLDTLTLFFFMFLVYGFLQKSSRNIQIKKLHILSIRYLKIVILICIVGLFFLPNESSDADVGQRTILGINIYRQISVFSDPNFFCTFLVIAFSFIYFSKTNNKVFYLLLIFILVILTGSKGGILALGLAFIFYYGKKIPLLKSKWVSIMGLSFIVFLLSFAVFKPMDTINKLTSLSFFDAKRGDGTILPRIMVWNSGMKAFIETPVLGIGPGNIVNINKGSKNSNLINYVENLGFYGLADENIDRLATHSNYLEILFEQGIIAFILYLIFIYKILKLCRNAIRFDKDIFLGYYISFSAFFLSTIFLSYNPYYISFLFGLFLFLYDNKINATNLNRVNKLDL
jgi:O-antigen ligase